MPLQLISDSSGSSKATGRTITMVYISLEYLPEM
jgi:hypothetical protein|tara:strand:- start:2285 stop:2386 length:102 start_codon:yes stop_codon:yes gene_type:complete